LTDYSESISLKTLLSYQSAGFKLIPLAQDAKTPVVKTTNEIYLDPKYWTAEKLERENYRFKNVATTFGIASIKDEEGRDLYLNECDIDSKDVFDRLAIVRVNGRDYFFIDEMRKITFVVKTKKKYGYRFYWLSRKQHPPIGTKDCKLGHEFEIKTDNTLGHGTLPPSRHRDDPNFHYQSIGQDTISIQDGLYDGILKVLADCLRTKNEKPTSDSNTYHDNKNNNDKISLTDKDIEEIVYQIKDFYQLHSRHDIVFGLSGYLYKNGIELESAENVIIKLCQTTNDEEKNNRITVLHNTYANGQRKGCKDITGYAQLLTVLTHISDANTATQVLQNIAQVLKKYKGTATTSIIEDASESITINHRFLTIEESKDILYYQNGVYVPGGDILIEKEAEHLYGYELSNKHLSEIQGHVMRRTYHKHAEIDADSNIKNMKNGLYNIITGEFKGHTSDYLSINLMAYTFCRDNIHEIIAILFGYGANGKSVFTGLLTALHGPRNVSSVPLSSMLTNTFALSDLENKDVNIDTELSSATIQDAAILKKLTGRQPIRIERKHERAYDTILHAKLFFSANKIPQTDDDSDAYYRRNIVISFPNRFEGMNDDPDLLAKLTTEEELSGIFNVLMIALQRLLKNNSIFVNEKTIQSRREKYEMAANPIGSFIEHAVAKDSEESSKIPKDLLYNVYKRYCKENKLAVESKENFGKILKNKYQFKEGRESSGERRTIWREVRLIVQPVSDDSFGGMSTEQQSVAA
jgi:putative DNA primase/helicase